MKSKTNPFSSMRIAYYQPDTIWESKHRNFDNIEQTLAGLNDKVDIILLPETFASGFTDNIMPFVEDYADGETLHFAQRMARKHSCMVAGSWMVRDKGLIYNRMHFVLPSGQWTFADKRHPFCKSHEHDIIAHAQESPLIEWKGWKIKGFVCYDLRFPIWMRNNYNDNRNYDLILVSANWPASRIDAWDTLLRARAIENQSYIVASNRTGTDPNNLRYNGHSAAYDYCGRTLDSAGEEVALRTVSLSLDDLHAFRNRWPFYRDAETFNQQ